jgi:hypothetical protein
MARGNSRADSELPPSRESRLKQAIKNAPMDTDYFGGRGSNTLTPFITEKNVRLGSGNIERRWEDVKIKSEADLFDQISNRLAEFGIEDRKFTRGPDDSDASFAFKKQTYEAYKEALENGTSLSDGRWEQTEVWDGEGESSVYKTVLKAPGAPTIEVEWTVRAYTEYSSSGSRRGEDYEVNSSLERELKLKSIKML